MTYKEALEYIHSIDWRGSRPGLSRVTELLDKLGNPQDDIKFIHVGGTNGKGSFCAMLSSILTEAGLKTGLFTSPYIENFNERMMINGKEIPNEELAELTYRVSLVADKMDDPPTEFELITAVAMLYFKRNNCDIVVLEVGLGGRLDATNIIKDPVLSVITGIALDHTAILGDTAEKIAYEKAGIIKKGRPVLLGCATSEENGEAVKRVVTKQAKKMESELFTTDLSSLQLNSLSLELTDFDFNKMKNLQISLLGAYQTKNAANVITAVDILNNLGYHISENAVRSGLFKARWKARFEILSDAPLMIFDGSHNPQGVLEAVKSIKQYFPEEKVIVVNGVLADKDYNKMIDMIASVALEVYVMTPDNPRALDAKSLADVYSERLVKATVCDSIYGAIEGAIIRAKELGTPILALGSLYTYNDVKSSVISAKSKVL